MATADDDEDSYQRAVPGKAGESITIEDDQCKFTADPKTPGDPKLPEDCSLGYASLYMPTTAEPEAMPKRSVHDAEDSFCAQTDGLDQPPDTDSSSDECRWPRELTESPAEVRGSHLHLRASIQ